MRRVVILRPEPGATATFDKARELGLDAVKLPLFEVEPLPWSRPDDVSRFDALLITSANAIRHGGDGLAELKSMPVYSVGRASAGAAREAGFEVAEEGPGGVSDLLQSIDPGIRLLHLAGADRIDPADAKQSIFVVPVYRTRAIETVDPSAIDGSVVLVHSPRAGARLAAIVRDRGSIAVAAISESAAEACGTGWQKIAFIDRPSDSALLALASRLCEKAADEYGG